MNRDLIDFVKQSLTKIGKKRIYGRIKINFSKHRVLIFLIVIQVGILVGGGKGAESKSNFGVIPLIFVIIGLIKKD